VLAGLKKQLHMSNAKVIKAKKADAKMKKALKDAKRKANKKGKKVEAAKVEVA